MVSWVPQSLHEQGIKNWPTPSPRSHHLTRILPPHLHCEPHKLAGLSIFPWPFQLWTNPAKGARGVGGEVAIGPNRVPIQPGLGCL